MEGKWVLPNRAGFSQWIYDTYSLKSLEIEEEGSESASKYKPFPHQRFVRDFMSENAPFSGILLYHGLGVGKTCAAIAVSEVLRTSVKRIIVMTQASLRHAFKQEMKKCGASDLILEQRWTKSMTWHPDKENGTEFSDLSPMEKEEVKEHINTEIEGRYTFVNYNGLNHNHLRTKYDTSFFDSSLIIIDEAHRFISRAMQPGSVVNELYSRIFNSSARKVLLTGTPMINTPFELSMLLNLVHGPTKTYRVRISSTLDVETIANDPRVDCHKVLTNTREVEFNLLPEGFYKESPDSPYIVKDPHRELPPLLGGRLANYRPNIDFHLPFEREAFEEMFLDGGLGVANPTMFLRRIQGLVSHFDERDASLYPKVNPRKLIRVPMSDHQLSVYSVVRIEEIKKERRSKIAQRAAKSDPSSSSQSTASVYKSFSRAVCNFAFPEDIKRPYPSRMKMNDEDLELDDNNDSGDDADHNGPRVEKKSKSVLYAEALDAALKELRDSGSLEKERLSKYSPKMAVLIDGIEASPGPCLIYSEFKTAEGMKILSMSMEARGYVRLRLVSDSTGYKSLVLDENHKSLKKKVYMRHEPSNPEDSMALVDLFNGNYANVPEHLVKQAKDIFGTLDNRKGDMIHAILITVSGSEGISLKNVRQVHLLEPFWNDVRVQQVVGRAVRANSHKDLDEADRVVDIFQYCVFIPESKKDSDFLLRNSDGMLTADEIVFHISQRKAHIANQFLSLLRKGSVDCNIFQDDCYNHDHKIPDNETVFPYKFSDDLDDRRYARLISSGHKGDINAIKEIVLKSASKDSSRTAILFDDGTIADAEIWRVLGRIKELGRAIMGPDGAIVSFDIYKNMI